MSLTSPVTSVNVSSEVLSKAGIAAAAASAAGATEEEIVQSAAMTAGTAAAEDARTAGKPEVTVEAEAAKAAESAAARAGASTNEAAEAGGEAAVLVAGQAWHMCARFQIRFRSLQKCNKATVLTPSLAENAWAIVNGTRCLNWWGILADRPVLVAVCLRVSTMSTIL